MAIVIGSKFKPFDYATMNNPVAQATAEHKELENAYGELATKASIWEGMANQQADPIAYQTYLQYANDLQDQANVLAKQGLNPVARRALNDIKSRYAQEITPIEQAYQKREALTAEQRKAKLQNPTIIFDRDYSTTSLDDLIKNPSMSYNNINGDVITKQVAQAASNLARQTKSDPRKWRRILGDQYYETTMKRGLSDSEILAAINQTEGGSKELQKIMDDVISTSGVTSWNSPEALEQVRQYANQGAWSALGQTDWDKVRNLAFQTPESGATATAPPTAPLDLPRVQVGTIKRSTPYNKDLKTYKGIGVERKPDGSVEIFNDYIKDQKAEYERWKSEKTKIESESPEVKDPKYKPSSWNPIPGVYTGNRSAGADAKNKYNAAIKGMEKAENNIKESLEKSKKVIERMRGLGDTEEVALQRGLEIEKAQGEQQMFGYPIMTSHDSGDKLALVQNLRNTLKTLPDNKKSGLVPLDSKMKPHDEALKAGKAKEILNDPSTGISVYPGIGYVVTKGNEMYQIRGIAQFDQSTERLQKVNQFLEGFTTGDLKKVPDINEFEGDQARAYDYASKNGKNLGNGMFGIMVKDGDDVRRIVFRPMGDGQIATYESSANDEISGGGSMRGKFISRMAQAELPYLLGVSEGISRPSRTASSKIVGYTQE